ncbi:MAG: hypothetical protein M1834_001429 [Cirrosporium novae-zelandiae]|nr:MAG: hypothetical protein M1834_001429 [Cirrosporium novae-zelandiae]
MKVPGSNDYKCTWTVEDTLPPVRLSQDDKDNKDKKDKKDKKSEKEEKDKKNEKNEDAASKPKKQIKLSYLTEQTSHHPPVSAFYINCPEKGITARGFDQLSAKFTGTTIRVAPGAHNLGIFINLKNRDNEEYQLTHPAAHLSGILRGALHVSVADTCFVTCPKTKIKVILNYLDEGWIGKAQNRVVGVIYRYDPENDDKSKIKDVPEEDVLVRIDGCWKEQVYFTPAKSNDRQLMVDLKPLFPVPKAVPPQTEQLCNESQKFWNEVTEAILNKQFSQATKLKHNIEERQRQKAAERETNNEEWQPRFFTGTLTPMGKPDLSPEGIEALKGLHEGNYHLPESMKLGA